MKSLVNLKQVIVRKTYCLTSEELGLTDDLGSDELINFLDNYIRLFNPEGIETNLPEDIDGILNNCPNGVYFELKIFDYFVKIKSGLEEKCFFSPNFEVHSFFNPQGLDFDLL